MPTIAQARQWYAQADPVHDFAHVLRVYAMAERLGQAEGGELEILRAAALLHDASGAAPHDDDGRASHHYASADFAREVLTAEGWPTHRIEQVLHCIRAHRFRDRREPPQTLEAKIIFDCDKLDVIGAIGVLRTAAYAALAGQPLTAAVSEKFRSTGQPEPGEPHTPHHEYLFKLSQVQFYTHTARAIASERGQFMAKFFERLEHESTGDW